MSGRVAFFMSDTGSGGIELISVHTPKCGGISLLSALKGTYGRGLFQDYQDFPASPTARMHLDPDGFLQDALASGYPWLAGKQAVHGHFWLRKYDRLTNAARITFLRHPVDRIISLYFYWRSVQDPDHPMVRYIAQHQPDIAAFANMEWIRADLTRRFFRNVTPADFDFIGFHEEMGEGISRLSRLLGRDLAMPVQNINDFPAYADEVARIKGDPALMARLEAAAAEEMRFYSAARERFC